MCIQAIFQVLKKTLNKQLFNECYLVSLICTFLYSLASGEFESWWAGNLRSFLFSRVDIGYNSLHLGPSGKPMLSQACAWRSGHVKTSPQEPGVSQRLTGRRSAILGSGRIPQGQAGGGGCGGKQVFINEGMDSISQSC